MPWRNGRGSTLEIARGPDAGEAFAWRLSLADIERSGVFSAYPGYSRALVLVAGRRLRLRYQGHGTCLLDPTNRGTRFDGAWRTRGEIPQGMCRDLSLIVRRGPRGTPVRQPAVVSLERPRRRVLAAGLYAALFVLEGSIAVAQSPRSRALAVGRFETLLITPGSRRTLRLRNRGASTAQIILLRWRAP